VPERLQTTCYEVGFVWVARFVYLNFYIHSHLWCFLPFFCSAVFFVSNGSVSCREKMGQFLILLCRERLATEMHIPSRVRI
jgi:hypothetical protein